MREFHYTPITSSYEPIWLELKKNRVCRVTAHRALHPRIKKAVCKRKDLDAGYKFEVSEHGRVARLSMKSKHSIIEFRLIESIGLGDI